MSGQHVDKRNMGLEDMLTGEVVRLTEVVDGNKAENAR
jgi:hypothetical protein